MRTTSSPGRRTARRARTPSGSALASSIAAVARRFHARGWALATSGNYSAVVSRKPLRLAITASGLAKGEVHARDIIHVNELGVAVGRTAHKPSAETLLHIEIVRRRQAGAVLHTHSVWGTTLSRQHAAKGGLSIEGLEMLKALAGVSTHQHREWIPIIENDQDMKRLAVKVGGALEQRPDAHAFLLAGHGLYTWGATLAEAERHVEALEFLLEVTGRAAGGAQ